MSASPIRKHELTALMNLGRGQAGNEVDEETMLRLKSLGLVENSRSGWRLTPSGSMDLKRRKALKMN